MNPARLRAYIFLLIVTVIWGVAGPVIKLTLKELPPFIFLTYRFLISGILAIPILMITKFRFSKEFSVNVKIWASSFLNTTGALGLLFWGTSRTSLLHMSLIVVFSPILSVLLGYILLKDHVTKIEKIGIGITLLGSLIILIEPLIKKGVESGDFMGNLGVLGYVVATSVAGLFIKEVLRKGVNPIGLTNFSFIIGFITSLPIVLFLYSPDFILNTIHSVSIPYHLGVWYMAILSGTFAFSLQNMAQKTIELSEAAVFMYLFPIISGILAIFVLGDKFTPYIAVGSAITFVGVFIAEWKKRRYN